MSRRAEATFRRMKEDSMLNGQLKPDVFSIRSANFLPHLSDTSAMHKAGADENALSCDADEFMSPLLWSTSKARKIDC